MKLILLVLLVITGLSAHAEVPPTERIDFHQTLDRVLKKSPDFDILKRGELNTLLQSKNAWSTLLPEMGLKATHTYSDIGGDAALPATSPHAPWSNLFGLSVTENLYDNGDSYRLARASNLTRTAGSLEFIKGRLALLLKVARLYYDYSAASGSFELQKKQIETLRQEFRSIESRYRQGVSSNRDYLRLKAQLQRAELSLASQAMAVESARLDLQLAVGEKNEIDFVPLVVSFSENRTGADLASQADLRTDVRVEDTLDYQIAKLQDEISDLKYSFIQRAAWPRLSLRGSYDYDVPEYFGPRTKGVDDPYWNLQASLVLDYALWDWGIRKRNVEIADNQRQIEKDAQETTRLQVTSSLVRIKKQLNYLRTSYRASFQALKDDEAVYESLNRGYRDGKISYIELITALGDLFSTRANFLSLQFNLLKARAELAFFQGNLDEVLKSQ